MTANLVPIYSCAALTITMLGVFAKQNRKSGWTRVRPNLIEGLKAFYADLGVRGHDERPVAPAQWTPVTREEAIDFSAQMLKLRSALGSSTPVTPGVEVRERELVRR